MTRSNATIFGTPRQLLVPVFVALLISPIAMPACAADKPTMNWLVLDLPPASIPVNGQLTDGFSDIIVKMMFAEWPEFEHHVTVAPVARVVASLNDGQPMCFTTSLVTPERERIAYLATTQLIPPLQLVVRADVAAKLPMNEKGEVLPAALFDRPDLRGLIIPKRSYSPTLDALLYLRSAKSGVRDAFAANSGSNILQMLTLGRADYTLEYEFVVAYQRSRANGTIGDEKMLKILPLAGTQPVLGAIACPHTDWGRNAIVKADAIIARISQRPEYQNALNPWLAPTTLKRYRKLFAEFYRQRAKPADPAKYPVWPSANLSAATEGGE